MVSMRPTLRFRVPSANFDRLRGGVKTHDYGTHLTGPKNCRPGIFESIECVAVGEPTPAVTRCRYNRDARGDRCEKVPRRRTGASVMPDFDDVGTNVEATT